MRFMEVMGLGEGYNGKEDGLMLGLGISH